MQSIPASLTILAQKGMMSSTMLYSIIAVTVSSLLSVASTSIGLQCLSGANKKSSPKYKYLVSILVISVITLVVGMIGLGIVIKNKL